MAKDRPVIEAHSTELSRSLSEFDITMIGVGAMIGAGIFVLTGIAAGVTGPSLMLVFALNGVVTIFTAMVDVMVFACGGWRVVCVGVR